MTPDEMKALGDMMQGAIDKAVDRAVAPIWAEIRALKQTDRKHSGVHRELDTNIRQSSSDIAAKVDDRTEAQKRRDDNLVSALDGIRTEVAANREETAMARTDVAIVRAEVAHFRKEQLVDAPDPADPQGRSSLQPAAKVAVRKSEATRVASDNADKQSLAAKAAANKALIAVVVQGAAMGLWQAYLAIFAK